MGSGVSVPQSINIVITEEIKNSTKIKIDDIKDYQAEVARLRQKLAEGYGIIEKETERLAEIARRVDTGKVKMIYQQYQELFPIENGKINVEKIDEDYCLSDVMPGCKLALLNNMTLEAMHKLEMSDLPIPFQPKITLEDGKEAFDQMYTYEDEPRSYTVVVYENPDQYQKDMEKVRARIAADGNVTISSANVERVEGCSCIEGNPCTDANKYNCKDWENRFAIAKKNGWKG